MSYATRVYRDLLEGKDFDRTHISAWQNFNMSRAFLDLGFQVDVFHFEDHEYLPRGNYDVIVDVVSNLGRLADSLGPGTVKILYPMFCHWTVHNARSLARHRALAERRGVALPPKRLLEPNDSVERADHIFCKGGAFGTRSYAYSKTPVVPVNQIHPHAINEFIERDHAACARSFLWIGGSSAVHKGLDLVLEAFAGMPELSLVVIGNVGDERRFVELYRKELYTLPNIRVAGWVDTMSTQFRELAARSVALVAPSATELSCGSVIAGMMNGLIPIATESTDIDVSGIGLSITEDSVDGVRAAIARAADLAPGALRELSYAARTASQERYGGDRFIASLRAAICQVLGVSPAAAWQRDDARVRIPRMELI